MAKLAVEWEWFFAAQTGLECSKRFQFSLTAAVRISVLLSSITVFTPPTSCEVEASEPDLTWRSQVLIAKALNSRSRRSAERFHEANKSSDGFHNQWDALNWTQLKNFGVSRIAPAGPTAFKIGMWDGSDVADYAE